MVSDTIGDLIIQLKNAGMVKKETVTVPYSKFRHAVAEKLRDAGYVANVAVEGDAPRTTLVVTLAYADGAHRIKGVKRVSKPGRRLYRKVKDVHPVKFGYGHCILSTPAGVLTDAEAREKRVGGEELFIIW